MPCSHPAPGSCPPGLTIRPKLEYWPHLDGRAVPGHQPVLPVKGGSIPGHRAAVEHNRVVVQVNVYGGDLRLLVFRRFSLPGCSYSGTPQPTWPNLSPLSQPLTSTGWPAGDICYFTIPSRQISCWSTDQPTAPRSSSCSSGSSSTPTCRPNT